MTDSIFGRKYRYDIALEEGVGAHLVTWVTGLMAFFVTLALAVNFSLGTLTKSWVTGLSGSLTVEIKPPLQAEGDSKTFDDNVRKALAFVQHNPAVTSARVLTRDEIMKLVEPWLGQKISPDMPLPALIDVQLVKDADVLKLQKAIVAAVPAATVDTHTDTLKDVHTLVDTIRLFVFLLTGVIILLAVVAISGIVRAKLSIHSQEVETLHLIGASDEYIARQFRQHTLQGTLKGAMAGVVCTAVTLFIIGHITHVTDTAVFPRLHIMPMQWLWLALSPILSGTLIAHLTAQRTVMKELARLP